MVGALLVLAGCTEANSDAETSTTAWVSTSSSSSTSASSSSSSSSTIAPTTSVYTSPPSTLPPLPTTPPPTMPSVTYVKELAEAQARGVPGSEAALVVYSGCWGRTSDTHWGYYNYFDGTTVVELDGAVIKPGWVCLNPFQASPYSSLVHELGHKFFFEQSLWARMIDEYGNYQRPAECFARIWGATVFGAGGCTDADVARMRAEFGW